MKEKQEKEKTKEQKVDRLKKLEKELNEAFSLLARIKFKIDEYHDRIQEDDFTIEPIDEHELLNEIYEQIDKKLPKKFLIAERLDIDDKETKILEALRKPLKKP
jgi:DNA-binding ferritin-like protein